MDEIKVTSRFLAAGEFAGKHYELTPVKHGDRLSPVNFLEVGGTAYPVDAKNGVLISGCWAKEVE